MHSEELTVTVAVELDVVNDQIGPAVSVGDRRLHILWLAMISQ